MKTHDGLHLSVATFGPRDAPLTVFLAHCRTLNKQGWHYQVRDLQRAFAPSWPPPALWSLPVTPSAACR